MPLVLALAAITGLGLALRLRCAENDLWIDEIWSLQLVHGLTSPDQVFWRISHDNNHFLNSLWLFELGPDRPPLLYRLPAVLFGTLSILVAARVGLRHSPATSLATAALVSTSYMLVNYGSEARGYAGMVLALLIALDAFAQAVEAWAVPQSAFERAAALAGASRQRSILAVAIGLGTLSHLTLSAALPVLWAAAVLRRMQNGAGLIEAANEALAFLRPALIALVPAMVCVASGIAVRGGIEFGDTFPFEMGNFLRGFGDMLRIVTGSPGWVPLSLVIAVTSLSLLAAARAGWLDSSQQAVVFAGLFLLPASMVVARLPNLEFARYFLVPAVILIVAQGRVVGAIWDIGRPAPRVAALAVLVALLLGQAAWTRSLIIAGRGSYGAVIDLMAAEGGPAYSSNSKFLTQTIIDSTAAHCSRSFDYVSKPQFCAKRPDWHISVSEYGPEPSERIELGPQECRGGFVRRASFPTSALSGMRWTLYARAR